MLKDASENSLQSFLEITHFNEEADSENQVNYGERTCIKLVLLSMTGKDDRTILWLQKLKDFYLEVEYHNQFRELSLTNNDTTLNYEQGMK